MNEYDWDVGYDKGYADGCHDGFIEGHDLGYEEGFKHAGGLACSDNADFVSTPWGIMGPLR